MRSASLAPITTATDIQFTIYSSPTLGAYTDTATSTGPLLWKGVYNGGVCPQITPDTDGYFAVQLGEACAAFPSYIDWNQTLYLGVRIGTDAEATPRVQLSAHPYALNAETVDTFSASSTAAANTLLALDSNLNFNILTGGFLGAYFTMSSSTVTSTIAGHLDVQGNTTLGSSSSDLISVNGRFNTDLVPNVDLAYSLGSAANRWNGVFGTVTTTNLNVLGPANFTDITWVNATGTNTTSTNLFATNAGATYLSFNSATGVSLNLTNTLYINTIAINATGTTSTNSGAWLIGVFDEFTFSNATNVQDLLDDLDTQLAIAATTDTLQTVTAAGNTTTIPIYVQNTSTFRDIVPETHNLYSLGTTTTRWKELFASTMYVGSSTWAFAQNATSALTISGPSGQLRVLVTDTGNMALNTTSTPTARLEVQSSGVSNQLLRARNSVGNVVFDISQDILSNAQMLYNNRFGVNLAILQTQGTGGSFSLRDTNGLTRVLLRGDAGANSYIDALNFGIGVTGPVVKLHVSSSDPFDLPIARFNNASGDIDLYSVTTTPEGAVFGGFGDLAVDAVSGYLFIKETADTTSTGWAKVATGTIASVSTTLQSAYNGGRTIQLASSSTPIEIYGIAPAVTEINATLVLRNGTGTRGVSFGGSNFGADSSFFGLSDNALSPGSASGVFAYYTHSANQFGFSLLDGRGAVGNVSGLSIHNTNLGSGYAFNLENKADTDPWAILRLSNATASASIVQYVGVGSPEGVVTGSSGSLYFQADATGGVNQLFVKLDDSDNTDWDAIVTSSTFANYLSATSTEVDTLQTVTNRGNVTTNTIQFAGGTSTGMFYAQTRIGVGTSTGSSATRLALQSSSTNSEVFRVYGTSFQPILGLAEDVLGNGQFILRDNAGNTRIDFYGASNGIMNMYDSAGNADFSFLANNDSYINTGANFGIGTTLPSSTLHIFSESATSGRSIMTVGRFGADFQTFVVTSTPEGFVNGSAGDLAVDSVFGRLFIKETGTSTNTGWVQIATGTNSANTFQTVTARGNTTTLPIYVQNTSTFQTILPQTGLAFDLGASTSRWNNAWINTLNLGTSTWSMTQNGNRQFQILNGPGGIVGPGAASRMVINNADGFVGFGESTNPQWALTVENSLSEAAIVAKSNSAGGTSRIGTSDNAGNTLGFYQYGASVGGSLGNMPLASGSFIRSNAPSGMMLNTDASTPIVFGTNSTEAMRVTAEQNIGIGTISPRSQFQVVARFNQSRVGRISLSAGTYAVDVQGRYAAVINRDSFELNIVDVSDPANMTVLGTVTVNKEPFDVVVLGHYVYTIARGTSLLYIYDITDPTNISVADTEAIGSQPRALAVQGRYAYTAGESGRFEVIDVADPSGATLVTNVGICADPARMTVKDRYAYVVCSSGRMDVVDLRRPSAPVVAGSIGTNRLPTDVQVQGRFAYVVSNRDRTLEIFDVSNPATPVLYGTENTNSDPISVSVQGDMAYVTASADNTVDFFDITDRSRPRRLGTNRTGGAPQYAAVQGRYIFVPNLNDRTLEVFDLGGSLFQQAEIGGLEADTLATREDAAIGGELDVKGGLHVGRSANINGTFSVYANAPGSASVFTIDESGQVGIGTLAPDNLLSVNGDASKIGGGTWQTFSDQRLKEDVTSFADGLNVITKINPVHFRYNGLGGIATGTSYIGVIAQDVQGIAPYMVSSTRMKLNKDDKEKTEVLTFDPNALTYALINSVKQQQGLIMDLQNRIGTTAAGSITVMDALIESPTNIYVSTSTFEGTLVVKERVNFGSDTVGIAKMLPGTTLMRVRFENPYDKQPIVNITPIGLKSIDYGVENITTEGFEIAMRPEQTEAVLFNWIAFGAEEGVVTISDGSTSTIDIIVGGPPAPPVSDTGIEPPP